MIDEVHLWHGDTIMYPTAFPHPWQHNVWVRHSQVLEGGRSGDVADGGAGSPGWYPLDGPDIDERVEDAPAET